jgi:hypothetical protein
MFPDAHRGRVIVRGDDPARIAIRTSRHVDWKNRGWPVASSTESQRSPSGAT